MMKNVVELLLQWIYFYEDLGTNVLVYLNCNHKFVVIKILLFWLFLI